MTRIALIRHGQTDWNVQGRIQGSTDIELNDTGREQALVAATSLQHSDIEWDAVLTSPLQRAAETARIIANSLSLPGPEIDARLVERRYGKVEGLLAAERAQLSDVPDAQLGIESREGVGERASAALRDDINDRDLIVVTHGGVISSLLRSLSDNEIPAPGRFIPNGSLQILSLDAGVLAIESLNLTDNQTYTALR